MRVSLILPNSFLPWADLHLGLGYVASALRNAGHAVAIADTKATPVEAILAGVARGEVDPLSWSTVASTSPSEAKASTPPWSWRTRSTRGVRRRR